jgi:8-oxo-dGTP pyrophosphatase MutT (NUDIX family)
VSETSSLRSSLRTELANWRPWAPDQQALQDDFVAYVDSHADAWSRTCRPDHVTASAIVLDATGTHVLLALHGKVGRWLQFGGHIEADDDSVRAAALRETVEESGLSTFALSNAPLRVDRHPAPCGARHHLDVQYLAVVEGQPPPSISAESQQVAWFAVDSLPAGCDDSVRALVADARSAIAQGTSPTP